MYWRENCKTEPQSRGKYLITLEILPLTNKGRSEFTVIEAQYEPKNDYWSHSYWKKTSHDTRVVAWMPLPRAFVPITTIGEDEEWNTDKLSTPVNTVVTVKLVDGKVTDGQKNLTPKGYYEWFIETNDGEWTSGIEVKAWKKKPADTKINWFE